MFKLNLNKMFVGILCIVFMSCNTYKGAKRTLLEGNYDRVITLMTNKYKRGVKEKNKKKLVSLLHEAYLKANARDLERIDRYKLSTDAGKDKDIYFAYRDIQNRQDKIKPYLPITLHGKEVEFPITDYSIEVETYKASYAKLLYNQANTLLDNNLKPDAREAYRLLKNLEGLYPHYKNLRRLQDQAYRAGTTFIYVEVRNNSEYLLPKSVEENLCLLDTRYLNKDWNEFHTVLARGITYDYDVLFDIHEIFVSPEVISRNQFVSEKEVIDGWEYKKDESGNIVLDSLGNKVKVDIIKQLRAEVNELHYDKNAFMKTKVAIINNETNHIETTRLFESNRFFSDFSCEVSGSQDALDGEYRKTIKNEIAPFPTDTEILQDCTNDIKQQIKTYLKGKF